MLYRYIQSYFCDRKNLTITLVVKVLCLRGDGNVWAREKIIDRINFGSFTHVDPSVRSCSLVQVAAGISDEFYLRCLLSIVIPIFMVFEFVFVFHILLVFIEQLTFFCLFVVVHWFAFVYSKCLKIKWIKNFENSEFKVSFLTLSVHTWFKKYRRSQMAMGMENPLLLMGGDFEFYCLQLKNPVGIPKILMLLPVGMRVKCSIPMGIWNFRLFFQWWGGMGYGIGVLGIGV